MPCFFFPLDLTVDGKQQEILLEDLKPETHYSVFVVAWALTGSNRSNDMNFKTKRFGESFSLITYCIHVTHILPQFLPHFLKHECSCSSNSNSSLGQEIQTLAFGHHDYKQHDTKITLPNKPGVSYLRLFVLLVFGLVFCPVSDKLLHIVRMFWLVWWNLQTLVSHTNNKNPDKGKRAPRTAYPNMLHNQGAIHCKTWWALMERKAFSIFRGFLEQPVTINSG